MTAPGISDNGAGLAALVAVARALHEARIQPRRTILFVADVGEEGEGNLRGMRAIVDAYRERLKAVIVLDGSSIDHVTTKALASRRVEVVITGPGGHSWSDSAYRILSTRWCAARSALSIRACRQVRALPIIWDKLKVELP